MKLLTLSFCFALLWSCQTGSNATTDAIHQDTVKHESHSSHEAEAQPKGIELNDGAKWLVNAEMKPFVVAGEQLVDAFVAAKKTDFTGLAKELAKQNDQLIKSCTMKGKSHEELHKWLHPHLELVKALSTVQNSTKGNELVQQLQKSYQQYKLYFD
jgi:hypothetical protein